MLSLFFTLSKPCLGANSWLLWERNDCALVVEECARDNRFDWVGLGQRNDGFRTWRAQCMQRARVIVRKTGGVRQLDGGGHFCVRRAATSAKRSTAKSQRFNKRSVPSNIL